MNNSKNSSLLVSLVLGTMIMLGTIIFIMVLFNNTKKEAEIMIDVDSFEVTGMYGEVYLFESITSIELKDSIPTILNKVNGAGLGDIKKGDFKLEDWGICRLIIHSNNGPYVVLLINEKYVIINLYDSEDTIDVYQELLNAWE